MQNVIRGVVKVICSKISHKCQVKCIEDVKCIIKILCSLKNWIKQGLLYIEAGFGCLTVRDSENQCLSA